MHHDRDWSKYNKELINRGKINFWIKPKTFKSWKAKRQKKNGRPFIYSEELIKVMLYIRFKYHLSLREAEGFFLSLKELTKWTEKVPCYTQVCRRMKSLELPARLLEKKNVTDIVLDTTGLKVYGAGEWRAKCYGGKSSWKKLHLAMDQASGKLILSEVSHEYQHDTTKLEEALRRANKRKGKVLLDGIGDSKRCYELAKKYNKELITPPKKGAIFREEKGYEKRNEALAALRGLGGDEIAKSIWAKLTGYNKRVVIESMVARWKKLYGGELRSRTEERVQKEVIIKALMINEMIEQRSKRKAA